MRILTLLLLWNFLTVAFARSAEQKPCTREEAFQAENDVDRLKDWDQVYGSYRRFAQCDDGAIGEGYSDAISKLLADKWVDFAKLAKLASADNGFRRFVLKHIDETIPADTLQKISENAKSRCPSGSARFCRLIAAAASP